MDIVDVKTRSRMMSSIRSKDTKIEIFIRKQLFSAGLRYRKNVNTLPGKPDLVFSKYNAVIFINGCYWHGHSCRLFRLPKSNVSFWEKKIKSNVARDLDNREKLENLGWRIGIVWECALRGKKEMEKEKVIKELKNWILGEEKFLELINPKEQN